LMDWEMNEMDGITATKQIIKNFPKANILLVTQYDDDILRIAAKEAGACGYVLKDDLSALRKIVAA
jgi:DNA-binding NarL/FixJ family response regulator